MAASFPTALQRTSDERWITLDVVVREHTRALARIREDPSQAAVVRLQPGADYDRHLRALLSTPPPEPGRGVHVSWPVDLLHDLDARAVGYAAPRPPSGRTFPLGDFVEPTRRAEIAPMATRRHLLRVARNVATATAALHHSGYARIRGRQFRLDDRARIVVVRIDELIADASAVQRADDQRRLGYLVVRLLGGRPWASDGELADLIRRVGDPALAAVPAEDWFFALRQAERSLPQAAAPTTPSAPTQAQERLIVGTDLATALRQARRDVPTVTTPSGGVSPSGRLGGQARHTSPASRPPAEPDSMEVAGTRRIIRVTSSPLEVPPTKGGPAAQRPSRADAAEPQVVVGQRSAPPTAIAGAARQAAAPGTVDEALPRGDATAAPAGRRRRRASHIDGRHTADAMRRRPATEETAATVTARRVFGVAAGLTFGGLASVAPFATFLAVASIMILRSAIAVGLRKSTMGPLQTAAITLTRLVPFATGGLALAAFILLDLLLVLGLCMALAERLFDYGPGFTLTWIVQLPEVPGLVRAFAFATGAFGGTVMGGQAYDRIRRSAGGRRMIATPAIAMALAMGTLALDASITWWPLPLIT